MITRDMLLKYIEDKSFDRYDWYLAMLSIPLVEKGKYFTYDKQKKQVLFPNGLVIQLDKDRETPLLMKDLIYLEVGDLNGIVEKADYYNLCDIIQNYLLVARPFGFKNIKMQLPVDVTKLEDYIANYLGDTIDPETDYVTFVDGADFLEQLSDLVVVASTNKSIRPAKGGRENKIKLYNEARKIHGDNLNNDIRVIVEIEKKIEEFDRAYMADDPTYGITTSDKIMGNARKNLHGTIGAEIGMDGNITPVIENSLLDGYPKDNALIATLANSSRKGSILRGHMTQFTGADAKVTLRVISAIKAIAGDCNTDKTIPVVITESNYDEYVHYYIMESGKPLMLTPDNIKNYIGKTIALRSYMGCIQSGNKYCTVCSGRQGMDNNRIATVLATENNAIFTNTSMKAMHDKQLKFAEYHLEDALF